MLQLLLRYDRFDEAHFDNDAENRANAGLTQLQRWQAVEDAATWLLFEVNDQQKAANWLGKADALGHAPDAAHVLRTS